MNSVSIQTELPIIRPSVQHFSFIPPFSSSSMVNLPFLLNPCLRLHVIFLSPPHPHLHQYFSFLLINYLSSITLIIFGLLLSLCLHITHSTFSFQIPRHNSFSFLNLLFFPPPVVFFIRILSFHHSSLCLFLSHILYLIFSQTFH